MKIEGLIWLDSIVTKLILKHNVSRDEVSEVLSNKPYFLFVEKGLRKRENVYSAMGKTSIGRYLIIFFVYKITKEALIISARGMSSKERKRYGKR